MKALLITTSILFVGSVANADVASLTDRLKSFAEDGSYRVAQACPYTGTVACAPGAHGPGGCYKPGYAECKGGLICTGGMKVCIPSNGSAAYCYAPQNGNCR